MFHDNEENDWTYSEDGVFVAAGEIKTTGFLLDHVRKRSDAPAIQYSFVPIIPESFSACD